MVRHRSWSRLATVDQVDRGVSEPPEASRVAQVGRLKVAPLGTGTNSSSSSTSRPTSSATGGRSGLRRLPYGGQEW